MIYRTENLTVDTDLYRLSRHDKQVEVEPQAFNLLVYLIENRDRVVSRSELLDTLWKGRVVSDSALSACLKAARKAIGDTGSAQNIIKTIHGRGYQFIADIEISSANEQKPNTDVEMIKPRPLRLPDKPSIAVLPFQNLSNDLEQASYLTGSQKT